MGKMLMKDEDYQELLGMYADTHGNSDLHLAYREYMKQGLSEMRFRWDTFWGIPIERRVPWANKVYKYLNDNHIDTALKRVVEALMKTQKKEN